ncbi:N-acyl-D-aspartate/D-glutamate deacylase [Panacagrimonas perspica]|uniref:N-acyl-D-aspartate/D-glutamate deacylase n=1 Tax=Panacagrimonas perspica TaxID=381431 RepID=A0A4S3K937_9GAMM|nr:amidohydrolase family protein [Panacagrimonas perspica]TDU24346.1 N-acyl-D-aspartate/D-glutamate deacylase [Panacagrimonas perspica]THD04803.1 N-acyl-D-glutamate deacylase [Panacagrimonas perspica]
MDGGGSTTRWDALIRDALVFDGNGGAPQRADVAVAGGRVVSIAPGLSGANADTVIEANGRWLTPGLLDIHTHFDLEVEIEPQLPEAVRHGTTTVLVANCSLGLAFGNQRRDGADPIVDCFARVENVPKHVLSKVADQATWNDSRAYLDHFDAKALGPNIVPMIPHSMLRIEVMGLQDSVTREPTKAELETMGGLLDKGMQEGYVGFSTDALPFHYLANQPNTHKQIPTQFAPFSELKFLTNIVRRWERVWQATPPKDSPAAVFKTFSLTSGRLHGKPLKLAAVAALDLHMNRLLLKAALVMTRLLNSKLYDGRFRLQALGASFRTWADGAITPLAEEVPVLRQLNELDLEDRAGREKLMSDPAWQADFRRMWWHGKRGFNLARLKRWLRVDDNVLSRDLRDMTLDDCAVAEWNGQSLQGVYERLLAWQASGAGASPGLEAEAFAAMPKGCDEADFMLELLRRFDTQLRWSTVTANRDPRVVKRLLFHPLLLPGFNDSGAHLTNMAFFDGNLRTLKIAQEDGVERVAQAVRRLTREPAEFLGIDAGRLEPGAPADLVLIDPERLQAWNPEKSYQFIWRDCFEARQLVNRPDGVVSGVMIGGRMAWQDGAYTPEFGHKRFGRLMLNRSHESGVAIAA